MESIEQTGRTVEEAVAAALRVLGASREEVEVEVLAEESRGLLGIFGSSAARVRVTRRAAPRSEEVLQRRVPAETDLPSPPLAGGEHSPVAQRAVELTTEMVRLMGLRAEARIVAEEADSVSIEVEGEEDLGLVIGKHGQTLAALQLLVAMIANRNLLPEERKRVALDAEGYRARRDRAVAAMARNAAAKAKRTGRPVSVPSLTPRERRVVHLTLAEDPDVTTRSEGEDPNRSVIVTPRRRSRYPG